MAAYKQGEFCWYELGTRDLKTAVHFYTTLMNWGTIAHDMGEMGTYYVLQLDGQDVGGAYQMGGPMFEGVPPHWMPYVWVDDVDATAAKVSSLGGKVDAPPMDVPDVGRMAFVQDPQGAHFALFMGREHQGATRLPRPGRFVWTELLSPDPDAARKFYSQLLGWTHVEMPGPGMTYTVFQVAGQGVAGMMPLQGPQFQGVPPHWTSYLWVADCDKTIAEATRLGASVKLPAQDVAEAGRLAVLQDPTGAVVAVIKPNPM